MKRDAVKRDAMKRRFFVIAGEASGDMIGAYILEGLKNLYGEKNLEIKVDQIFNAQLEKCQNNRC